MQWDRKIACNVCSYIKCLLTFTGCECLVNTFVLVCVVWLEKLISFQMRKHEAGLLSENYWHPPPTPILRRQMEQWAEEGSLWTSAKQKGCLQLA